jgi:hypothetical protein
MRGLVRENCENHRRSRLARPADQSTFSAERLVSATPKSQFCLLFEEPLNNAH